MSKSYEDCKPTPPGELLEVALKCLEGVTAENFQERIEVAGDLIYSVKSWIDSTVLICGETSVNPAISKDHGPDHPTAKLKRT